jgi:hypothetical protein
VVAATARRRLIAMGPSELDLTGAQAGGMNARAAAEAIYAFAKQHGLIDVGDGPPADLDDDEEDEGSAADQTQGFGQQAVIDAFQRRPIKLVTYDNHRRVVTIFTDRPLGVRVRKKMPYTFGGAVNIQYMASGDPEVRGNEADEFSAEPCYLTGVRYGCGGSIFPANRLVH